MAGNREGTGRSSSSDAFSTLSAIVVLVRLHGFGIQGVVGLHLHRWAPTEVYAVVGVHLDRWARTHLAGLLACFLRLFLPCFFLLHMPLILNAEAVAPLCRRNGGSSRAPPGESSSKRKRLLPLLSQTGCRGRICAPRLRHGETPSGTADGGETRKKKEKKNPRTSLKEEGKKVCTPPTQVAHQRRRSPSLRRRGGRGVQRAVLVQGGRRVPHPGGELPPAHRTPGQGGFSKENSVLFPSHAHCPSSTMHIIRTQPRKLSKLCHIIYIYIYRGR